MPDMSSSSRLKETAEKLSEYTKLLDDKKASEERLHRRIKTIWTLGGVAAAIGSIVWGSFELYQGNAMKDDVVGYIKKHDDSRLSHPHILEEQRVQNKRISSLESTQSQILEELKRSKLMDELQYYKQHYQEDLAEWERDRRKTKKPRKSDYPRITELEVRLGLVR